MDGIEAGTECERLSGLLSAVADGEASGEELALLRPHLRTCLACRTRLRGTAQRLRGLLRSCRRSRSELPATAAVCAA